MRGGHFVTVLAKMAVALIFELLRAAAAAAVPLPSQL